MNPTDPIEGPDVGWEEPELAAPVVKLPMPKATQAAITAAQAQSMAIAAIYTRKNAPFDMTPVYAEIQKMSSKGYEVLNMSMTAEMRDKQDQILADLASHGYVDAHVNNGDYGDSLCLRWGSEERGPIARALARKWGAISPTLIFLAPMIAIGVAMLVGALGTALRHH